MSDLISSYPSTSAKSNMSTEYEYVGVSITSSKYVATSVRIASYNSSNVSYPVSESLQSSVSLKSDSVTIDVYILA